MTELMIPLASGDNDIVVRPLNVNELETAYKLELSCYTSDAAATLEAFKFRQKHFPNYFWSAWYEDQLIGLACAVRTIDSALDEDDVKSAHSAQTSGRHLCILSVAVHNEARRSGIGTVLMSKLLQQAKKDHLESIFLMCERNLIPFYSRLGFEYKGLSPSQHGGIEWHEMRLDLVLNSNDEL